MFLFSVDKRHLRVSALRIIPLLDTDRDLPNDDPALSSKGALGPDGFNRLAIPGDLGDRELFIWAQLYFRTLSRYRSLARSGSGELEKNKEESQYICLHTKTINASIQLASLISTGYIY